MSTIKSPTASQGFVLIERSSGHTVVPESTPLTRLNYYDGLFLRAEHLKREQDYFLELHSLANQAGGSGLVHGFDLAAAGADLQISPGLGFDGGGGVLLLPQPIRVAVADLVQRSQFVAVSTSRILSGVTGFGDCVVESGTAPDEVIEGAQLYLVTVSHAEALCGEEDVYGKLCEEACVTSTERPFRVDGLVFRARPLVLGTAYKTSTAETLGALHTRSLVASAYYADEVAANPASISGPGLRSRVWCNGALSFAGSLEVPLGVLGRSGDVTTMLDGWIARRERIGEPPRRYWAWRMAMRPWNVYLAQILQFQCHLRDALAGEDGGGGVVEDPCKDAKETLRKASAQIDEVMKRFSITSERLSRPEGGLFEERLVQPLGLEGDISRLNQVREELAIAARSFFDGPDERVLVRRGIVETPSAGYLPVLPVSTVSVNEQVRKLLGDGVDLRFCSVRADFVPHALEEAQHMERICLLQGLDNPAAKPRVDVLVPEGRIRAVETAPEGAGYDMRLDLTEEGVAAVAALLRHAADSRRSRLAGLSPATRPSGRDMPEVRGAARGARTPGGGYQLYYAGRSAIRRRPSVPEAPARDLAILAQPARGSRASRLAFLRANLGVNLVEAVATERVIETEPRTVAVWLELGVERDPFEMRRGESTPINAVVGVEEEGEATELFLDGSLRVIRTLADSSVEARLDGRLTARLKGRSSFADLGEHLRLTRSAGKAGAELQVVWLKPEAFGSSRVAAITFRRVQKSGGEYTLSAHATAAGVAELDTITHLAASSFTTLRTNLDRTSLTAERRSGTLLLDGSQSFDERALLPGSAPHDRSTEALSRLAAATRLPRYSEEAPEKLFPPAPEPTSQLIIEAVHDWVLFHRRRDKRCGVEEAPPVRVSPRRYRLYHAAVGDAEEIARLRKRLAVGGDVAELGARFVGEVEYAGGNATLTTPHDVVRHDWDARVADGVEIVYGAIVSVGDAVADGEVLSDARLGSLGTVLDSVTPLADDFQGDVLAAPPPGLQIEPADGAVLLVTLEAATVCHAIFRLEGNLDEIVSTANSVDTFERFRAIISDGRELQPLATVEFRSGRPQFAGTPQPPVARRWQEAGNGTLAGAVVFQSTAGDAPLEEPLAQQAIALAREAAGTSVDPILVSVADDLAPCPVVTVLVAEPRVETVCNEVVVLRDATTPDVARKLLASAAAGRLPIDGDTIVSVGPVQFEVGTNEGVAESMDALVERWNQLVPNGLPQGVSFTVGAIVPEGTAAEEQARAAAQSGRVAALLDSPAEVETVVFGNPSFPSKAGCPAITLLILTRADIRTSVVPVRVTTPATTGRGETVEAIFRFDENNELIRDRSFDSAVGLLQDSGVKVDAVEFVGTSRPRANDKRLRVLMEALTERGVATANTTSGTAAVTEANRERLAFGGFEMPTAFVLTTTRRG